MTPLDLDGRTFRAVATSPGGDVDGATIFHYRQRGDVVTAAYAGGAVVAGHLLAVVRPDGTLDARYHHVGPDGRLRTGRCTSTPERLPDGRLCLHERWAWTDVGGAGTSVVEEA